jgi:diacylglycerol O-acyltransferase / wax synthase
MTGHKREKISAVDTAWLRMDRPSNLMMICGVMLFAGRVRHQRLTQIIETRFLKFHRFRQRPVQSPGMAYWETVSPMAVGEHIERVTLPGRAGRKELQALVSRLASVPLDPQRPLWQFHLVENYEGASALIMRIHHCYADGIALVRVLMSMTDAAPTGPPAMPFEPSSRSRRGDADDPLAQLMLPLSGVVKLARKAGAMLIERGAAMLSDPAQAVTLAEQGGAFTAELAKLALMPQDSKTRFKGTPGVAKRVAWAEPISLDEVKVIGNALGASVNDVLLSCVAGALREYLVAKGDPAQGVMIRALVPVNLRPLEKAYRLGNQFGLVFLDLPLAIENPVERLYAVRANMNALKGSYQPVLALGLLAAMGAGPKVLQEQLLQALARNGSAVMTNVPGPSQQLYFAGAKIDRFLFWVPQSGDIGMGVSILSYAGRVQFGLIADAGLVPDPECIVEDFGAEFEKLVLTTLLAPWPREGELDPALAARAVAESGSAA